MENLTKMSNNESVLSLSKEQLFEKLLKAEREIRIQHDLLKETFLQNKNLQNKCADLEIRLKKGNEKGPGLNASWVSKIVLTLKTEDRPLRSVEIIKILETKEPLLESHHNKAKFFSAYLNSAVKYKRILPQKVKGVRGYYYILPEWMNECGSLKGAYCEMMI
jgi:hypothetical protein